MKVVACPAAFLIFQMLHAYCWLSKCMSLNPYSRTRNIVHARILLPLDLQKEECRNNFQLSCNAVAIDGGYWSRHIDATGAAYHLSEVIHIYISHPSTIRGESLTATHLATIIMKVIAVSFLATVCNRLVALGF